MTFFRYVNGCNTLHEEHRKVISEALFIPDLNFISDKKSEIVETVRYYKEKRGLDLEMPLEDCMFPLEKILINCYATWSAEDHRIDIVPAKGVELRLYPSNFIFVQEQVAMYEQARRASLYKFVPNMHQTLFLPKSVMKAMAEYDWSQHEEQMLEWERTHRNTLRELSKNSNIAFVAPKKKKMLH